MEYSIYAAKPIGFYKGLLCSPIGALENSMNLMKFYDKCTFIWIFVI